ncbi:hypothetical protein Ciccas_005316 [Cichlidogyrus casuarinus]|uniref:Uncharacterized protein n=1 Tax=Cichlidogyrus casuarinus TaxID=1844966 RepID=A0ABD2Q919_9PLAT
MLLLQLTITASHVGSLRDQFATFMGELSNLLAETEAVFIWDNAPIPDERFDAPYSPQQVISVLKASIKNFITNSVTQDDRTEATRNNETLSAFRIRLLHQALEDASPKVTPDKIRNFYRKIDAVIADCAIGLP